MVSAGSCHYHWKAGNTLQLSILQDQVGTESLSSIALGGGGLNSGAILLREPQNQVLGECTELKALMVMRALEPPAVTPQRAWFVKTRQDSSHIPFLCMFHPRPGHTCCWRLHEGAHSPPQQSRLPLPSTGVTEGGHYAWLFRRRWAFELKSSCLYNPKCPHRAVPSPCKLI